MHARNIKVALNTGYDRATAEKLVAKVGWKLGEDFDSLVTASDVSQGRPAPDMIFKAMEDVGISSSQVVAKVGDSQVDIEEGHNATCGCVLGVTTGAQGEELLQQAKPTAVIQQLKDLLDVIL